MTQHLARLTKHKARFVARTLSRRPLDTPVVGRTVRTVTNSVASGGREHGTSQVQSVDRAIAILYLLARRGDAGVTEVAAELGVHKSTAFRLITALDTGGLIEQDGERGKYRLGRGILRLAAATAGGWSCRPRAGRCAGSWRPSWARP